MKGIFIQVGTTALIVFFMLCSYKAVFVDIFVAIKIRVIIQSSILADVHFDDILGDLEFYLA